MAQSMNELFDGNKEWVSQKIKNDPEYFMRLSKGQTPPFLWIGCSDSRVPANEITGTNPGEIFVHRNIANMVVHTDMSMLSVLDYSVNVLGVKHVIVCGHYGCGGVLTAMGNKQVGIVDNWLRNIKDVYRIHQKELNAIADLNQRGRRLVELNVQEQVSNLCKISIIQSAWAQGRDVKVHGLVYDLENGLLQDLNITNSSSDQMEDVYVFNFETV